MVSALCRRADIEGVTDAEDRVDELGSAEKQ